MRAAIALLTLTLLAGCEDTQLPPPPEPLQFTGPTFTLNVTNIDIAQDYKSPKRPPNVEHMADLTPADAVKQWASVRLVAAGHQNSLEVDIEDASIIKTNIPKKKEGIVGMFTTEQTEQYDGSLEVEIKLYSSRSPLPVGQAYAKVHVMHTLPQDATPFERTRTYHQITIELMKALETEMDMNIRQHLSAYLM